MSFKDNLNNFVSSVKVAAERTSNAIYDAIEHEDTQAAIAWSKNAASTVADEATRLGNIRSTENGFTKKMVTTKVFIDADQLPSNVPAINPAKISRNVIAVTSPIYGSIDNTSHANSSHRLLLDSCPDLTGRTVAARTYGSSSSEEGSGKICVVNYQKATSKDGLMVAASVFESA